MQDYVAVIQYEDSISVCFYIENDTPFAVGEKMNKLREEAYMNGYNWDAVLNYYLQTYHSDVCEGMETDPEAGMYVAYYQANPENAQRAARLADIIQDLVENEEKLYQLLKDEGDEIEWD